MAVKKRNRQSLPVISARTSSFSTPNVGLYLQWVHRKLCNDHPRADSDELLSDAGLGITLAFREFDGIAASELEVCQTAYRRAIDAHREQHPPANRARTNPQPTRRDMPVESDPVDPAALPAEPDAAAVPDLYELLDLVRIPRDREVLQGRSLGHSLYQIGRDLDVSPQRVQFRERRAIADIRLALGLGA